VGILCRGSDDALSRVFLIRGPYWRADDPLMVRLHTKRSGVYVRTADLKASDAKLTEEERLNLTEWWNTHGSSKIMPDFPQREVTYRADGRISVTLTEADRIKCYLAS
jgi:hypothetical protein